MAHGLSGGRKDGAKKKLLRSRDLSIIIALTSVGWMTSEREIFYQHQR